MKREPRKRTKKEKTEKEKKLRTMDVILVIVATLLISFTIVMIITFKQTGAIPDTLVTCVFACLGGECGAMAWIKTTKERYRERDWEKEDRDENQAKEDTENEP